MKIIKEESNKKKKAKPAHGWFYTMGGNPEVSLDKFNKALGNDVSSEGETTGEATGGEAGFSGGGGMGESLNESDYYTTQHRLSELIKAGIIHNPNRYSEKQINAIYLKNRNKLQSIATTKEDSKKIAKYIIDKRNKDEFRWVDSFEDEDIYQNIVHGYYIIDGIPNRIFNEKQDAIDYIQGIGEY